MKMMERTLITAAIALMLWSCHGGNDTGSMQELSRIDSLLSAKQNEEAQQRIQSIQPKDFSDEENAYYSLLLTQSHYKNYIDDTTDAVINKAVEYYKGHGDNEKRTRSLLYQGCVYEVMGKHEEAIASYKNVEEVADNNDLENKAYAKLRLAVLYADNSNYAQYKIDKYKEALDLYCQLGDKHYQIVCLTTIGGFYRDKSVCRDSALYFINQAIKLSEEEHENWFLFENLYHRAENYCLMKKEYEKAKVDILKAIEAGKDEIDHPRAHYIAAEVYLNLGNRDSAMYYLNHAPAANNLSKTVIDTVMYYRILSEIAKRDRNWDQYTTNFEKANSISDSVLIANVNKNYLAVEKKYDLQLEELNKAKYQARWRGTLLVVALLALVALALTFLAWRYRNRLKMKQNEAELLKLDLNNSLSSLEQMQETIGKYKDELKETEAGYKRKLAQQEALVSGLTDEIADVKSSLHSKESERLELNEQIAALAAKEAHSDQIKTIIDSQIKIIHELIQSSYELDGTRFASKFSSVMTMPEKADDTSYWTGLHSLVNDLHDNVLVAAQDKAGGSLRDDELNFLALYCCGFSRTVIMICMKYTNLGTISNKKIQIAHKLGVNNLDDFVAPYR